MWSQEIAANTASHVDKIVDFAAVGKLSTWDESLDNAWHKHERPRLLIGCAAENDATVARLRLEQSPLVVFKVGAVEGVHPDNTCSGVSLILGQRQ